MSTSLQGKVAVVTGGGRGIGKAITHRLAEAGANVVIASRQMENLQETAQEFSQLPGKIHPVECHVGRADQLQALVGETEKVFGPVDSLVNNAGWTGTGPALNVAEDEYDRQQQPEHDPDREVQEQSAAAFEDRVHTGGD